MILLKLFAAPALVLGVILRATGLRLYAFELFGVYLLSVLCAIQLHLWQKEWDEERRARAMGAKRFRVVRTLWPFNVGLLAKAGFKLQTEEPIQTLVDCLRPDELTCDMRLEGDCSFITLDPNFINFALSDDFTNWQKGDLIVKPMEEFSGHTIFGMDPHSGWKDERSLLRPFFAANRTKDLDTFRPHCDRLLEILSTAAKADEVVDAVALFSAYFLDTAMALFLGESCNAQSADLEVARAGRRFQDALSGATEVTASRVVYEIWPIVERFTGDPLKPHLKVMHDFMEPLIERVLAGETGADSLARAYADTHSADATLIRDAVLGIMLGAKDTLNSLLSSVIFLLASHPAEYDKGRKEVVDICGQEEPTSDNLRSMTYIKAILDETLRLYPPAPTNARQAIRDTKFLNDDGFYYFIPAGSYISYSLYQMQRAVSTEFKPGRKDVGPFQPFHAGPRLCMGITLAYTQATYVLARIMQRFARIEPAWKRTPSPSNSLSLVWRQGVPVRFVPAR